MNGMTDFEPYCEPVELQAQHIADAIRDYAQRLIREYDEHTNVQDIACLMRASAILTERASK